MATATAAIDPLTLRLTGYITEPPGPGEPHPKQHAFLMLDCREALYGGAAGGGKSGGLLMGALQYVDVPGYSALILRKTHAQLAKAESILSQAHSWLRGTDARYSGSTHTYYFPSGATLEFGHLQHEADKYNYQGAAYQYIGFDEATQFLESEYRYLFSRCRQPAICEDPEHGAHAEGIIVERDDQPVMVCEFCGELAPPAAMVPLRVRAASNPGGTGHLWVRSRFIRREPQEGDERRSEDPAGVLDDEGNVIAGERVFLPARLADNPSINARSYIEQMSALDPQTRQQLLNGDWDVREPGACFTDYVWAEHTIEGTRAEDSPWPSYRGIDFGWHHGICLWAELYNDSLFVYQELDSQKQHLPKMADDIVEIDQFYGVEGCEAFIDPAGLSTNYQTGEHDADVLRQHGINVGNLDTADRFSREQRTDMIRGLLRERRLIVSRTHCPYLAEALLRAVEDTHPATGAPKGTYRKDGHWDHPLDALGEMVVRVFRPMPAAAADTEPAAAVSSYGTQLSGSEFG